MLGQAKIHRKMEIGKFRTKQTKRVFFVNAQDLRCNVLEMMTSSECGPKSRRLFPSEKHGSVEPGERVNDVQEICSSVHHIASCVFTSCVVTAAESTTGL